MNLTTFILILAVYYLLVKPLVRSLHGSSGMGGFRMGAQPRDTKVYRAIYIVAYKVAHADNEESAEEVNAVVMLIRTVMGNPRIPADVIIKDYRRYGGQPWQEADAAVLSAQYRKLLLDVAISVALSDRKISKAERGTIHHIAQTLGFDVAQVNQILDDISASMDRSAPRQQRSAVDFAYERLGLNRGASAREIKKRYQQLAMKHHPDRAAPADRDAATETFKEIGDAYRILKGQY